MNISDAYIDTLVSLFILLLICFIPAALFVFLEHLYLKKKEKEKEILKFKEAQVLAQEAKEKEKIEIETAIKQLRSISVDPSPENLKIWRENSYSKALSVLLGRDAIPLIVKNQQEENFRESDRTTLSVLEELGASNNEEHAHYAVASTRCAACARMHSANDGSA